MWYRAKALISGILFLGASTHALTVGTEISFVLPDDTSAKLIKAEISANLKDLIENKSPEQVKNVPAIAVYLARCKQANVSDSKDAYLVFTKTGAVFVHKTWIKNNKKGKA